MSLFNSKIYLYKYYYSVAYTVLSHSLSGAVPLPLQVLPQGIESVNGSNVTMGCARPVGTLPGTILTICGIVLAQKLVSSVTWWMVTLQLLTQVPLTGHLS